MVFSITQANLKCNIRCLEAIIMRMSEGRFKRYHTSKVR